MSLGTSPNAEEFDNCKSGAFHNTVLSVLQIGTPLPPEKLIYRQAKRFATRGHWLQSGPLLPAILVTTFCH